MIITVSKSTLWIWTWMVGVRRWEQSFTCKCRISLLWTLNIASQLICPSVAECVSVWYWPSIKACVEPKFLHRIRILKFLNVIIQIIEFLEIQWASHLLHSIFLLPKSQLAIPNSICFVSLKRWVQIVIILGTNPGAIERPIHGPIPLLASASPQVLIQWILSEHFSFKWGVGSTLSGIWI